MYPTTHVSKFIRMLPTTVTIGISMNQTVMTANSIRFKTWDTFMSI